MKRNFIEAEFSDGRLVRERVLPIDALMYEREHGTTETGNMERGLWVGWHVLKRGGHTELDYSDEFVASLLGLDMTEEDVIVDPLPATKARTGKSAS